MGSDPFFSRDPNSHGGLCAESDADMMLVDLMQNKIMGAAPFPMSENLIQTVLELAGEIVGRD